MVKAARTVFIIDYGVDTNDYNSLLRDTEVTYQIIKESSNGKIFAVCRSQIDVILLEFCDPDRSLEMVERVKSQLGEDCPPIVAIGNNDAAIAVQAIKLGAADYLVREGITSEKLVYTIDNAIADSRARIQRSGTQIESDLNLQAIAVVPDLLWCKDPQGNIWCNQRWLEYTGQTFTEACSSSWLDAIHPGDRADLSNFQNAVDEGSFFWQEYRIRSASGEYRWFLVRQLPIKDEKGRVVRWISTATDIHDWQIDREQQLLESEKRWRKIIEHLPVGAVFVVDRDLRYLHAVGEALHSAGFKPEDLIGRTIYEVIPPELIAEHEELYQMGFAGESFVREHNAHGATYVSRGTPLRDSNGDIYAVLAVSYDITERKQAEAALQKSQAQLADNLAGMMQLHRLNQRLLHVARLEEILQNILTVAAEFTQTNKGNIQLVNAEGSCLEIIVHQGHSQAFLNHFSKSGSEAICESARREKQRVIIEDVVLVPTLQGTADLDIFHHDGIRAVQSTPIINRQGQLLGMLNNHYAQSYRPSENELQLLDLLAQTAADFIESTRAKAALAADLKDTKLLHDMSTKLLSESNIQVFYDEILATAIALMQADAGTVQILELAKQDLLLLATQNITPKIAEHFYHVDGSSNTSCGVALTTGDRTFIDFDVPASKDPDGSLRIHLEAGFFSAQSTPLISRSGKPIGMLTTHWRKHHRPSERELRFLDLLARQAADLIEQRQAESQLRRAAELDAFQVALADELRSLADPVQIQAEACRLLGEYLQADRVFYIDIEDDEDRWVIADSYVGEGATRLVGRGRISDFGWASDELRSGKTMSIADVNTDVNLNQATRETFLAIDVLAVLAVPLIKEGKWSATFALHHLSPRQWNETEIRLTEETAERTWAAVERAKAEQRLRASELQRVREQATLERERERAETLAELDRVKTQFFSNVSHEFRTPLTLLLAPLQDALEDRDRPLPNPQRERLEIAYRNSLRLLKLVNTLLDFSRVEAGRLQANYEPTDLATYTVDLASMFRSAIENAGLQLVVDCPPLPEPIYVDRQMWSKIIFNLLSNAFKFTFTGTITVSLKPKITTSDNLEQVLTVSDTGTGIPTADLPYVFQRFYQSKGTKGRSYEGSGIGLSLVRELVKLHGGEIEVSSQVDRGTTFTVTLPTGTAHLPAESLQNTTPNSTAMPARLFVSEAEHWLPQENIPSPSSRVPKSMSSAVSPGVDTGRLRLSANGASHHHLAKQDSEAVASVGRSPNSESDTPRILIVDDNADLRNYLQRLLSNYYQVETVNNGLAALTAVRQATQNNDNNQTAYDLVLADIMIPVMDGLELLRSLRADPDTQEIPIILLSARASEESQVAGLEAGADDYLFKPFSARELLARVKTHLELTQMRREATHRKQVMQEVQALNKTLEYRVQERTAQLEAINQELEAFSYFVSHDLQTPLRYISSFAQKLQAKLKSTQIDPTSQRYLKIILESAEQSRDMIHNLLEFSRLEQTQMQFTLVSMEQLVEQVRQQLQLELDGRLLQWQIEPLPEVKGDREMLRLVWQNLLSNAVKYTRERTPAKITIGSLKRDDEIVFLVRDNGVGFNMEYRARLFTLFQRLHSQKFPGTGVGLAHARRIIHRHGGKIWAEGAVDEGATFYFSISNEQLSYDRNSQQICFKNTSAIRKRRSPYSI